MNNRTAPSRLGGHTDGQFKKILSPGRNCSGIYAVDRAGLLIDGRDYYYAFYQAALQAESYILIAGWQFDSETLLLRGRDRERAKGDLRFIEFLNRLCAEKPDLHVYILAWNFSVFFAFEREWFQEYIFRWTTCPKIHFRFDASQAIGASLHHKFVVIDGKLAFAGGMDICANRWDDRCHDPGNPYRIEPGDEPYGPYHETQCCLTGEIVGALEEIYKRRWVNSGGYQLELKRPPDGPEIIFKSSIALEAKTAAISRTQTKTLTIPDDFREIKALYQDAVLSAREVIYVENQYFTSLAIYKALVRRMRQRRGDPMQIILVLPERPEAFIEQFGLGEAQSRLLGLLKEEAEKTGHFFGAFYSTGFESGEEKPTYTHSKLFIVDDRFLNIGSANTTNRSLSLDSELNISFEAAGQAERELIRSVRHARVSLLMEHAGLFGLEARRTFAKTGGLVSALEELAANKRGRLRRVPLRTIFDESRLLRYVKPSMGFFDRERPYFEENINELLWGNGIFSKGITALNSFLKRAGRRQLPH